ncbi:tetratricopeptide repeat protein [Thermodesulfobacteriota bacterium]
MEGRRLNVYNILAMAIISAAVLGCLVLVLRSESPKPEGDGNYVAALQEMDKEDFPAAIEFFRKSLKSSPKNGTVYLGMARAYVRLQDWDKALESADKALEYGPDSAAAHAQRGVIFKLMGYPEKALKDLSRATELNPQYAWAYAHIAAVRMRQEDLEKALTNINRALALNPDFADALRLRALILTKSTKYKEAYEDFDRLEKTLPQDAACVQDKAWFLLTCPDESFRDAAGALELARRAYDLSKGRESRVLETLAEAYFQNGQPEKAEEWQAKAIELETQKCPDGACVGEMRMRLEKYQLAGREETRPQYQILPPRTNQ